MTPVEAIAHHDHDHLVYDGYDDGDDDGEGADDDDADDAR